MKTIELSAVMAGAPVLENLKNFAGLDAQNALGLMTPERLAAVAGGLSGGVYEDVDLGLPSGTLWAKHNIGATKETEYGDLFGWGCTNPYRLNGSTPLDNTDNYAKCYANKIQTDLRGVTDTATALWGKGWRMPTKAQLEELVANCTSEWTQVEGVSGRKFTSKINSNYIFFPASGYVSGASLRYRGANGHYWSSSFNSRSSAWRLSFYSSEQNVNTLNRFCGFSVRAVRV